MPEASLDDACQAKALAFSRGAMTASSLISFLKKYAASKKGQTLDKLVEASAQVVPNESRRALLIKTYASLSSSAQASSLTRFTSAPFTSPSVSGFLLGGKYRVISTGSQGPRISSGKSAVLDAVMEDNSVTGSRKGISPLKAKLSRNLAVLQRERNNIIALRGTGSAAKKSIIEVLELMENYDGRGGHALVMEAGKEDLVAKIKRDGASSRQELKKICATAGDVLLALEKRRLVWTDLRAANFVLMQGSGGVKAIDLESAVPMNEKPVDCTPEVTPPEVASLYVQGRLTQATVAPSYDVWSLGILLLFLASGGKNLFEGEASSRVMTSLASATQEKVDLQVDRLVGDTKSAAFIKKLLVVDPKSRLSAAAVKRNLLFF